MGLAWLGACLAACLADCISRFSVQKKPGHESMVLETGRVQQNEANAGKWSE
jgi:hypothetical protein